MTGTPARAAPAARPRARSSTTSTPTASATPASPGSPAGASGPTTTTTASATRASPTTTPTRPAATRSRASSRRSRGARTGGSTTYSKRYYRLREQRPGGGTDGWACTYPNASTSGGFASGKGGDFGCGWGPIDAAKYPHKTGKDFGNYKKPKITVIKKLVPASDAGRFDLKVDGTTVKAAAGDGGTGTTYVKPGSYTISESARVRHEPRRLHRLDRVQEDPDPHGRRRATTVTVGSGDEVVCTITNTRKGKVEIAKVTEPAETGGRSFAFSGFAGGFNLAHGGLKTVTGVLPRSEPYTVTEAAATGYRLKAISCTDGDSTTSLTTRTASIKVAPGETVRCTFTNKKLVPGIEVVKSGPAGCTTATRWSSRSRSPTRATRRSRT